MLTFGNKQQTELCKKGVYFDINNKIAEKSEEINRKISNKDVIILEFLLK